jgi:hypothetical protein
MRSKAKETVEQDKTDMTEATYQKFEKDAAKQWNLFYKHNTTNFFKDRHYIEREFDLARYMHAKMNKISPFNNPQMFNITLPNLK